MSDDVKNSAVYKWMIKKPAWLQTTLFVIAMSLFLLLSPLIILISFVVSPSKGWAALKVAIGITREKWTKES